MTEAGSWKEDKKYGGKECRHKKLSNDLSGQH
jgi:hypothetical protein